MNGPSVTAREGDLTFALGLLTGTTGQLEEVAGALTKKAERYVRPGALPKVRPAPSECDKSVEQRCQVAEAVLQENDRLRLVLERLADLLEVLEI